MTTKQKKLFVLISEDWQYVIFSTKKHRDGYQLSSECYGHQYELIEKSLTDLGVQYNTPYSLDMYHKKEREHIRTQILEVEKGLAEKKVPHEIEEFIRKTIEDVEKWQLTTEIVELLGRQTYKARKER